MPGLFFSKGQMKSPETDQDGIAQGSNFFNTNHSAGGKSKIQKPPAEGSLPADSFDSGPVADG